MDLLKKIKSDCTFNQGSFISKLPSCGPYFSFDLSAATDRMPIVLQQKVISSIIGKEKSEAWARLLTSTEFLDPKGGQYYKYNTGQPMGAYSS